MSQTISELIAPLFVSEPPTGRTLPFRWRLILRKGRPFLLLPEAAENLRADMELYSAQRPLAKISRITLPLILKTPAASLFSAISVQADTGSEFARFLAEQSGVPVEQLRAPAIKFGGLAEKKIRMVLLLRDQTNRPVKVVKVGSNRAGRLQTEDEAGRLNNLPKNVLGCIHVSGSFSTEKLFAFATPFFFGQSPENDAGMEILFQSWLDQGEPVPMENLDLWPELATTVAAATPAAWNILRAALAGQKVRATLYHGDFAPWNIRSVNSQNLQAFDWERGHLRGIPGWDWFHFVIQTAILVKRQSPQQVAAELDQLVQTTRFQKYAQDARISHLIEPLLLAHLLHMKHVVQPLEGGAVASQLFDLLWAQWRFKQSAARSQAPVTTETRPAASAWSQIKSAWVNLANLFWEPSLSLQKPPPFFQQFQKHWKIVCATLAWFFLIFNLPLLTSPYLIWQPFYLIPCIYLALKVDRRLASLMALVGAVGGPLYFYWREPDFVAFQIICWNIFMRVMLFQLVVTLLDRVRRQSILCQPQDKPSGGLPLRNPIQAIAGNWPVILMTIGFFLMVVLVDIATSPKILLVVFYIIPCVILTLAMNWRWGTAAALVAAITGPLLQRPDPGFRPLDIEIWNTAMRFLIYQMVVLLLERIRRENILFFSNRRNGDSTHLKHG